MVNIPIYPTTCDILSKLSRLSPWQAHQVLCKPLLILESQLYKGRVQSSSFLSFPDMAALNLNNGSSGASDQDTLAPLPHPAAPWPLGQGYPYQYPLPPPCFPPAYQDPGFSYGSGSAGSQQSEGKLVNLVCTPTATITPDHLLEFLSTVCAPVLWFPVLTCMDLVWLHVISTVFVCDGVG